jgi:hypothetical protein
MCKLAAAVLSAIIAAGMAPAAMAADSEAGFNGEASAVRWNRTPAAIYATGGGGQIYDLFGEITKNLVPGDKKVVTVSLRNDSPDEVTFSLRARALTGEDARALTGAGGGFAGKTASDALLDMITLEIENPLTASTPLYSGAMAGSGGGIFSSAGAVIGRVSAGWSGIIRITVSVDAGLTGADYANALAAMEWSFFAEQYNDDAGQFFPISPNEPAPGQSPGSAPAEPLVEIDDEGPPLGEVVTGQEAEEPPLIDLPIYIEDEDVPLADFEVIAPKTGDDSNVFAWAALCAASGAVLAVWLALEIVRRRRERAESRNAAGG